VAYQGKSRLPQPGLRLSLLTALVAFSFAVAAIAAEDAPADEQECDRCHDDVHFTSAAHPETTCQECHTNIKRASRHRKDDLASLNLDDICAQCHRLADRSLKKSVHDETAACRDCHGPAHNIPGSQDKQCPVSPTNQIDQCGSCHNDPPELVEGYVNSVHGRGLLRSGLLSAPACSTCHGNHRILAVDDEKARTSDKHAPEMCGDCHSLILDDWVELSAHGIGWKAGDEGIPVCTTCHSSHKVVDPMMGGEHLLLSQRCEQCHGDLYTSYRGSLHGKTTNLGFEGSATCADCHTPHKNLPADDPRSSIHPDNLAATCGACHEGVSASFLQFDPHNDPTDVEDNAYVYYVYVFMISLLIGVFAFFGIHDLLWLQRSLVGALRGEFEGHKSVAKGAYVRRFPGIYIFMHATIIITFLLLALTGLPLKFDSAPWAQTMMDAMGGVDSARIIHRIAAIGTFGYMLLHVMHVLTRLVFRRERGLFWGPNSMVPQLQDLKDMIANVRYFMYSGPRPAGDRWAYWEKFDYLAVFWGVAIIGLSGLMLWIPTFFANWLPGWTINAAYVIHSDEALLATGFIFVFHFFHTHLRPESFPMDPVVFTGRMPLEKFREERPKEYQRMVDEGTLEKAMCDAPTREEMVWVSIFGFSALFTGLVLAVAIFWAFLSH
jgi:thiosulfate reductase cytochrome b subunit